MENEEVQTFCFDIKVYASGSQGSSKRTSPKKIFENYDVLKNEKKEKKVYSAPATIMLKPKSVRLPVFDEAVNVSVAEVDWPALRTVFSRFQVNVKYELAFDGDQFAVVMVSVTGTFPVFLTYTVLVVVDPAEIVPQLIDVQFCVHWLLE